MSGACRVCGAVPAAYTCSECEGVSYCSPKHQANHWANLHHAQCPGAPPSPRKAPSGGRMLPPTAADVADDTGTESPVRRFREHRDGCRERALSMMDDGNVRGALVAALEAFRLTFGFHGGDHPDLVNDYLILGEVHGKFGLGMEAARCAEAAMRIMTAHPQLFDAHGRAGVGPGGPWGVKPPPAPTASPPRRSAVPLVVLSDTPLVMHIWSCVGSCARRVCLRVVSVCMCACCRVLVRTVAVFPAPLPPTLPPEQLQAIDIAPGTNCMYWRIACTCVSCAHGTQLCTALCCP
jgi:hypothetical protein